MSLCKDCLEAHKKNDWYLSDEEKKPCVPMAECSLHPILTNWRVARTLRSLKYWSLCGENYRHPHAKGVRLCLSFGRVHRRTAEAILFDYEKPFIDLLIKEEILEQEEWFDDVKNVLRVLPKHDEYLRKTLTFEQYKKFHQELLELAVKENSKL